MRLRRFHGIGLNGYLTIDLDFHEDLTFLTGINGTGKTSALNAMASLLMPRLDFLAIQTFKKLSLVINADGENVILAAAQDESGTYISCTRFPGEEIYFQPYEDNIGYPQYKQIELEHEYYREIQEKFSSHPVMQFIMQLPTPMFLGLDRRSRSVDFAPRDVRPTSRRLAKRAANVFGSSLSDSLSEALHLAERSIFEVERRKLNLDRE
ncbi:hypothetical protein JMM63_20315, partial [Rhodovulum sulfidophilum]|uniref:hypothetical protein n=1 Tax=Rhodovulum sulfidophilum TaxID=35806 RepID=UPI0019233886